MPRKPAPPTTTGPDADARWYALVELTREFVAVAACRNEWPKGQEIPPDVLDRAVRQAVKAVAAMQAAVTAGGVK